MLHLLTWNAFFFSRKEKRSHYERCRLTEAATGGFLKNFAKFIAKQLCQSLFFDKVAGLRRKWDKWDQPLSDREMGSSYASTSTLPFDNYVFKVNMRNTRTRCEMCSKLTIKIPEPRQWRRSDILLLTLNVFHTLF